MTPRARLADEGTLILFDCLGVKNQVLTSEKDKDEMNSVIGGDTRAWKSDVDW